MIDFARIEEWLEQYKAAWKTDDPGDIARLFTEDARYYTAPYRDPYQGRAAIVTWWIGQGDSKIPWEFDYEVIAQEGDLYVVRGVTRYPQGGSIEGGAPEVYHNLWLVTLTADGRASDYVEYWMEADRPAALEGSSWSLREWSEGAVGPSGFEISARFAEGRMAGKAAVNRYTGQYTAGACGSDGIGSLSVGSVATTKMAGPEPAMRAEDAYLGLLAQVRGYRLDFAHLALLDANGEDLLVFEPVASG
jgi:heat shock protein HslJ